MASLYILFSTTASKYYIGVTKDLQRRIQYHLRKEFHGSFTAKYNNWELFFEIPNLEIGIARKIEFHIKKMKSKIYIKNLKKHPEIAEKLVLKYS